MNISLPRIDIAEKTSPLSYCLLIPLGFQVSPMRAWCEQCAWELSTEDGLTPKQVSDREFEHVIETGHYALETVYTASV